MTSTTQKTNFSSRIVNATGLIYTIVYLIAAAWVGTQIWVYNAGWYLTATNQLGPQWQQSVTSYCLRQIKGCRSVTFDMDYLSSLGWSSGGFVAVKRRVNVTMDAGMEAYDAINTFIEPTYRDHVSIIVHKSKGAK
ncbi:hypothetical protein Rfer_4256 (plasmid) [Rhodoferax ferrireducens T118]|uniref:Uncharacterized protein n=1 Tax=Albidiferax ferrireducens (strain ATCC BAA-621 / DSM 15236 / T118) TaxID=338969 RepID=Q21QK2_ALBFT|nr:hypothetical protein [Rhodoferax ferrireducens]ABD71943.1 hypothetical protein Rfer_4256 [Rhodoferax ferrireducens T118]